MKFFKNFLFLFILGFASCIPYKQINIQYINKPEINISSDFNKPIILANFYGNRRVDKKSRFEYAVDSLATEEAVLSFKENLRNSPWFDNLDIPIRKYIRFDSSKYIKPLPWKSIKSIASQDSADIVFSLEYIKLLESSDSYKTYENEIEYYYGYLSVPIFCYWRVYDVAKNKIPNGYLYRDTLIWDARDFMPVEVGNQLPGYFSASAYAGNECGEKYAEKIAPIWKNDRRVLFYLGSKTMEKAAILAMNGKWIEAASEWQKVLALKKRKLSARAAFNLALANEMLGKFDIALEWLRNAKKLYPLPEIDNYRLTIEDRINNSIK